jgi:integrase
MDWKKVPELMSRLGTDDASRAVAFVTLTAVRAGSVEKMTWGQIDDNVWAIPATKEGEALDVPLSTAAKKILGKRRGANDERVFRLGANTMLDTFKSFGYQDAKLGKAAVLHGQRSAFKDWHRAQPDFTDEVSEIALGHAKGSEVRRRYARDKLFDKRRALMNKWAAFATGRVT